LTSIISLTSCFKKQIQPETRQPMVVQRLENGNYEVTTEWLEQIYSGLVDCKQRLSDIDTCVQKHK
jgi:hypothetical protein